MVSWPQGAVIAPNSRIPGRFCCAEKPLVGPIWDRAPKKILPIFGSIFSWSVFQVFSFTYLKKGESVIRVSERREHKIQIPARQYFVRIVRCESIYIGMLWDKTRSARSTKSRPIFPQKPGSPSIMLSWSLMMGMLHFGKGFRNIHSTWKSCQIGLTPSQSWHSCGFDDKDA